MRIRVQYLGQIRAILNKKNEEVEVPPKTTVYELLKRLSKKYGKEFKVEVFEDDGENVREGVIVTVNGKAVKQLRGIDTPLKLGDIVALLPLFAGGG